MRCLIFLIPAVLWTCDPSGSDDNKLLTGLSGAFLFIGSDTVQLRFDGDSIMYEKVNSAPEAKYSFTFRDSYLMSRSYDSVSGSTVHHFTGKIVFLESAFDLNYAYTYTSASSDLNATWRPASGTGVFAVIKIVGDSMLISTEFSIPDTTYVTVHDNMIFRRASGEKIYDYKLFPDTLLLRGPHDKTWRFNKV